MYKTVQITCFTKPFYVSAFGFVGCILIFLELRCSFFDINIFGIVSAFLSIGIKGGWRGFLIQQINELWSYLRNVLSIFECFLLWQRESMLVLLHFFPGPLALSAPFWCFSRPHGFPWSQGPKAHVVIMWSSIGMGRWFIGSISSMWWAWSTNNVIYIYIYVYNLWKFNIIMECHIYVCIVNPHCLSYLHYQGLHRSIVFSIEPKRGNRWQPRIFDAQCPRLAT